MREKILTNALNTIDYLHQYDSDYYRIRDVINCVNENQFESKTWLVKHFLPHYNNGRILIQGSWYGLLAMLLDPLPVTCVDSDPKSDTIGWNLTKSFGNIDFKVDDFIEHYLNHGKEFDCVINTSIEHIEQEEIDFMLGLKPKNQIICFQSNNYFEVNSHINCSESLEDFVESLNLETILYKGEKDLGKYKRFLVIGK